MGVATRHRVRSGGKLIRGRSQRHDFKISPHAPDLRFRHARTIHRGLSSRVWKRRIPVRRRTHHVELRFSESHFDRRVKWKLTIADWAARRAWLSTPKGDCMWRLRWADGAAWFVLTGPQSRTVSVRPRHRGPGVHSLPRHGGMLPTTPSIAWMSASRAGLFRPDAPGYPQCRDHRGRFGVADAAALDTNSLYLTDQLNNLGVEVVTQEPWSATSASG